MTHVADDETIGRFVRRIKGLLERALVGSLNLDKLWDIVQGYLDGKLTNIEGVLSGSHRIVETEKPVGVFTLDTTHASMPQVWKDAGWKVGRHRGLGIITVRFADGEMYINGRKVVRYLSKKQETGVIQGDDLIQELAGKQAVPDAVLDLLIREQDNPVVKLFLKKYSGCVALFVSTIYYGPDKFRRVRVLEGFRAPQFFWRDTQLYKTLGGICTALILEPLSSESGT